MSKEEHSCHYGTQQYFYNKTEDIPHLFA